MLRRVSSCLLATQRQSAGALATAATASARWCSTSHGGAGSNTYQRQQQRRGNGNNRRSPYRMLPPAFDIVHWNDDDISAGHLLRVIHQDSYIVLDYHKQSSKVRPSSGTSEGADAVEGEEVEGSAASSAPAQQQPGARGGHAERVVTVTLPPVYIARFLGVLEGRTGKVEVQSRLTDATFAKKEGTEPQDKAFVLSCSSRRPTSGQRQTVDGQDVTDESVAWKVDLDAAESLMLHRFLTQALQYNTGFARRA